ncbi:MAG TPA: bifunctional phosphoribosylaminoimidazolecarboxamide formyltransferase/IMP cyclohydrolase [Phycisphaerales bacterium]|nr:bifunctional phosphoribosylaminoimidazolecarboxamide formyltransferase/IMP cyclohydrolase [Phycisphaerales bacterium]
MPDLVPIRRALLSVSDKTGIVEFAHALAALGAELISTGGTARSLAAAGLTVTPVERVTGFPEMMDGRVKTLHPAIHGGILALRDHPDHAEAMRSHAIGAIDLVCVNLYPFERTIAGPGVTRDEAIEQIDIGGPAMVRSAAKNHEWVAVVTDPADYSRVLHEIERSGGATTRALRADLAAAAFAHTSAYDASIAAYLRGAGAERFPAHLRLAFERRAELRYGENPHQAAAAYALPAWTGPSVVTADQLHGKPLSYNNLLDAAAALDLALMLSACDDGRVGACVVKHTNPCGAALAESATLAVELAIAGDPLAGYGGIVALSAEVDASAAERLCGDDAFFEVVVAPSFEWAALERLRERWKNLRLLQTGRGTRPFGTLEARTVAGGLLVQERDDRPGDTASWVHAAGPAPTPERLAHARALDAVVRALSSNAVAIGGAAPEGGGVRLFGAGAGQMDRLASCRIAAEKAGVLARGAIAASDAFFPFPDGPSALIDAGVTMIVHPGGSKRDAETLTLCQERGVTCLTTGLRRFRH